MASRVPTSLPAFRAFDGEWLQERLLLLPAWLHRWRREFQLPSYLLNLFNMKKGILFLIFSWSVMMWCCSGEYKECFKLRATLFDNKSWITKVRHNHFLDPPLPPLFLEIVHNRVCCVARRLERNIKEILDEIGETKERFETLLTGKRVLLAEELSELVLCQRFAKKLLTSPFVVVV